MNLLGAQPVFTKTKNGNYVMEIDNSFFDIDEEVKTVMLALARAKNYSQATDLYNEYTQEVHSEEDFTYYSTELLKKFDLNNKKKSFLLFEKILIPEKTAGTISQLISFLFYPPLFWIAFSSLTIFSVYNIFFDASTNNNGNFSVSIIYTFALYFVTILFHEFGHVAACRRFTDKNGGIGFGIYILYPVFYSNISAVWHATKQQKVIANLAGIYMQLWFVLVFYIAGTYTGNDFFVAFSKVLVYMCFIQILPFIRSDGYWLLSDLTGVANLLDKSGKKVNDFLKHPFSFFNSKNYIHYFLFLYGVFNLFFVISFSYYEIRYNYAAILDYPFYVWGLIRQFIVGDWHKIEFDVKYFSVTLFYYIIYSYGKQIFQKIFGKPETEKAKFQDLHP
ncbi:hypothetical protein ASG21_15290 [Chryseobacterium sp. Leaf394]|nr:hypothetical protein ASG21_15290 [Chryseobacterium sp. Leaf394]